MSEKAKKALEIIEDAVKQGKVSDLDLGTMLGIAMMSTAGAQPCRQ